VVSQEVVTAVYLAMLGYPPDAEGLGHWQAAPSAENVIDGLAATDRYRERARTLLGNEGAGGTATLARAAWRLENGAGLVELSDLPPTVAAHAAFEVLPWAEVCSGIPSPRVRVLGRYARELSAELAAREPAATVEAGLSSGVLGDIDVMVLTRGGDLQGLVWARPDVIRSVVQRLILPVQIEALRPADEVDATRAAMRVAVHQLGFTQVRQVFRQRHGGGVVCVDSTYATPEPAVLHRTEAVRHASSSVPHATWFIADRVAAEALA